MYLIKINKTSVFRGFFLYFLGVLSSLSLPPINIFPTIFFLSIGIQTFLKSKNPSSAFLVGLLLGFGWFSSSLYWVSNSLLVGGFQYYWMLPFSIIFLPLLLSLFWAFSFYVSFKISKFKDERILLLIIFWTLMEFLRGNILSGFPWNMIGFSFSSNLIMSQTVSFIGIYGQNLIILFLLSFPVFLINNYKKEALTFFIIPVLIISCSGQRLFENKTEYSNKVARLVQPSFSIQQKWDKSLLKNNIEDLISLSSNKTTFPDIIIWPETALTVFPDIFKKEINDIADRVLTKENSLLFTGAISRKMNLKEKKYNYFNSILIIDKNGSIIEKYNKNHLVPFGEYFPFRNFLPFLKPIVGEKDFSKGKKQNFFEINNIGLIKALICYESIFPIRDNNFISYDLILNITNDYWFGETVGPKQHLYLSRNRAIETGTPLVRVANNGISVVFDSYGRELNRLELNEKSYLDVKIPKKIRSTLYSKWHEKPMFIIIFFIIIIIFLKKYKRKVDPLNVF